MLRNITARVIGFDGRGMFGQTSPMGAFFLTTQRDSYRVGYESNGTTLGAFVGLNLDANQGADGNNAMAGHANGSNIRPYTILSVPIYVY